MSIQFELLHTDGGARRGRLHTPHGVVETPVFMPVGTQATVKGLTPQQVADAGAQIILGNTYHLTLRPGDELIAQMGGLHRFMNWNGPILTDSGGFQVYSLAQSRKIDDRAAVFRSHIDGALLELSPESAVAIQEKLGSDIAMCLDECPPFGTPPEYLRVAVRRTIHWAERCRNAHRRPDQALFAIVQGGTDLGLRAECAAALGRLDCAGYALGGFSVGETPEQMAAALAPTAALLPADRPRYLMGVGRPQDILAGIVALAREEPRAVFLEDYDIALARYLVQGADVWLNNPRRFLEASGTSGMKAGANGGLNVSILDGWWDEAYRPELGWAVPSGATLDRPNVDDEAEAEGMYRLLEREVVPAFYQRDESGIPKRWVGMMRASIRYTATNFSARRMVTDYFDTAYAPGARRVEQLRLLPDWGG